MREPNYDPTLEDDELVDFGEVEEPDDAELDDLDPEEFEDDVVEEDDEDEDWDEDEEWDDEEEEEEDDVA